MEDGSEAPATRRARYGRPKVILSALVAIVVIGGLVVGLTRGGGEDATLVAQPELNGTTPAPAISGPALDGSGKLTLADYRGRPVIINAWASWCGPCREEGPDIARFARDTPGVAVLGLNLNDLRDRARRFNTEIGWSHPSIFDPNGRVGFDQLEIRNLPVTIYIDSRGIERGRTLGTVTYDVLADAAARLNSPR